MHAFLQSPGAIRVATAAGGDAQRQRVERRDRAMIRADEPALRGIDHLGQQLVRDDALPVVVAIPAFVGRPVVEQRMGRADGQAEDRLEADVALAVAEDTVGTGEAPAAEGLLELVHVLGSDHVEHGTERVPLGLADWDSLEGHLVASPHAHRDSRHDRTEVRLSERERVGTRPLDLDRLGADFHVAPGAVEKILVRMVRVGLEQEQVRLVGAQSSQAPGDVRRETDQEAGAARHPDAAGVEGLAADVVLAEQRRIADGGLRVADEHRRAGRGPLAAHDPGVAESRPGPALRGRRIHLPHQVMFRRVVHDLLQPRIAHVAALDHGRIITNTKALRGLIAIP